jgi:hypothetical protein
MKKFTVPDNLDLFNLSTVSREFSNEQVVSLKISVPFLQSTYLEMSCLTILGGGGVWGLRTESS